MEKFQFHKEKNTFMDWLMLNEMSTGEIALWHTLATIGNRLGQRRVFNAPASTLMKLTGLSKRGMENARKNLLERGMIGYTKGSAHKAPIYEMIPLENVVDSYVNCYKKNGKKDKSPEANAETNAQDDTQNCAQNYPIHKEKEKEKRGRGSGNKCAYLCKLYEENIGKVTPVIRDEITSWLQTFNQEVIEYAIFNAIKKGGRTFSYLETMLEKWQKADVKTFEQVKDYEAKKEWRKQPKKIIPIQKNKPHQPIDEDLLKEWAKEEWN